jgi:hypothetical protein
MYLYIHIYIYSSLTSDGFGISDSQIEETKKLIGIIKLFN